MAQPTVLPSEEHRTTAISQSLRVIADVDGPNAPKTHDFTRDEWAFCDDPRYRLRVAGNLLERKRAWGLAYRVYRSKGYARESELGLWYGIHDALADTITFIAERQGDPVAALTVVFDSLLGLPADHLFADEIAQLRRTGRRPCELVSLVSVETNAARGAELVRQLFRLAHRAAEGRSDDLLITVNPRHTPFYIRKLLFERFGPDRTYEKVNGALATPLRLDLHTARERYRQAYAQREGGENLYAFFCGAHERPMAAWIESGKRQLDADALRRYFVDLRPLLPDAPPLHREAILAGYASSACAVVS
ncbi:MAG: hypothetical protein AMXMBFR7_40790 [Planctomycetota bacterium]